MACGCTPLPASTPHVPRGGFGAGVAAGSTAGASDTGVAAGSTADGVRALSLRAERGLCQLRGRGRGPDRRHGRAFHNRIVNRAGAAGEQDHGQE